MNRRLKWMGVSVIGIALALLIHSSGGFNKLVGDTNPQGRTGESGEEQSLTHTVQLGEPKKTKRQVRDHLSHEETLKLLAETVIEKIDLPEQTLADRVEALNAMLASEMGRASKIRVVVGDVRAHPDDTLTELRLRRIPLRRLLRYVADTTRSPMVCGSGYVEFTNIDDPRYEKATRDGDGDPYFQFREN